MFDIPVMHESSQKRKRFAGDSDAHEHQSKSPSGLYSDYNWDDTTVSASNLSWEIT